MRKNKSVLGVIPARLNSTRLPQKLLIEIEGRPLLYYTWRQANKSKLLDEVVVATDSKEIYKVVESFGGKAVMTSSKCKSGSDRVAETVKKFPWAEVVVNIQGDEPVLSPEAIDAVVKALKHDRKASMATVGSLAVDEAEISDNANAKIAIDRNNNALYFSRSIIPFPRNPNASYIKHIGIYAFRRDFLMLFRRLKQTPLEKAESLEQLRALEHGYKIKVATGHYQSIGVDTPEDLSRVSAIIKHVL